jgi:DNA-binding MarR family transcriptional regulator
VLARRLGALLAKTADAVHAAGNETLDPLGLGVRHFGVLTFLRHEAGERVGDPEVHEALTGERPRPGGRYSQQAIGERLGIDRTTMVALIDELEERGWVRRERNPADRRAHVITLTPAGKKLQERAERELDARSDRFFGPLSEAERAVLRELLVRLIREHG